MFTAIGQNFKGWKDNIIIPVLIEIGPEFQCLGG